MKLTGSFAFTISDINLDFVDIERNICLKPTKTIKKGQVLVLNRKAPFDVWTYEVKILKNTNTLDQLCYLIDELMPYSIYIRKISSYYNQVTINCFLRSDMSQIGFEISTELTKKMNSLGISTNFHILSYGYVE